MDQFYSLLCHCWGGDAFDESKMDLIMNLPLEISIMILRLLDPRTLLAAILVNRRWCRLIRSDCVLRKRVCDELRKAREAREARTSVAHAGLSGPSRFFTRVNNGVKPSQNQTAPSREIFLTTKKPTPVPAGNAQPVARNVQPVSGAPQGRPQSLKARQPFTIPTQRQGMVLPKQNAHFTFNQTNSRTLGDYLQAQPAVDMLGKSTETRRQSRVSKATKYRPSKKLLTSIKTTSLRL